jgi:hypothetical protein
VRNGFKELLLQFRTLHVRLLQDEKVGILTHSD